MSSAEAAASLFGSEVPDSDPFATLGAERTPQYSSNDLFGDSAVSDGPGFLNATPDGETAAQDVLQLHTQSEPPSDYSSSSTYLGAGNTIEQGWYDEQGQLQRYGPNLTTPAPEIYTSPQQHYSTIRDAYTSYVPASNTYAPSVNAPASSQPPYNPYMPSQSPSNHLPTRPSVSTTSPYNSYAYTPLSQPELPPQFTPAYASGSQIAHTTPAQTVPLKPTSVLTPPLVPPPTATVIRPKISNAYDPPFPTTTRTNRRTGRVGSGPASHGYSSGAYGSLPPAHVYTPPAQSPSYTSPTSQSQRSPLPLPTLEQSRLPPQSSAPASPPTHSPGSLMQSNTYHTDRGGSVQSAAGMNDVIPDGNELDPPESHNKKTNAWAQQSSRIASLPSRGFPDTISSNMHDTNCETTHSGHLAESSTPTSAQASPLGPVLSATSFRAISPHEHALPPSPTSSQTGRSSPFLDSDITTKRTLSPKLTEIGRGKSPDVGQHTPRDNAQTTGARSFQHIHSSPLRSSSPSTTAVRNTHAGTSNPYLPRSAVGEERSASPANIQNGDPYAPKVQANGSKGEITARSTAGGYPARNYPLNSYIPAKSDSRDRSMSNGYKLSSTSSSTEDPYAPPQYTTSTSIESDYGNHPSRHSNPNGHDATIYSSLAPEHSVQEILLKSFQTPYAPSPSLLGANDPLGRTTRRPIFSFGFGGKFVTCFHGADSLSTGFDVALSARNSTGVHLRTLKSFIPESALDTSTVLFPGPLFGDPTALSTSLVRSGTTSQAKTKKANVIKYLSERTDELALGLRYLNPDSIESRQAEGKVVLVKLLQLMVEHDGRLTGTPELDLAVRLALVPRLEGTFGTNSFSTIADTQGSMNPSLSTDINEPSISVTTLRASNLDKIQDFLLRGERRQAYHYALDEKLWAHAMVISSSIDKEAWKEVVNEFVKRELGATTPSNPTDMGRESLRAAYSLYSGHGAAAVQELVPQNILARTTGRLQPQAPSHSTPRTPNFAPVPPATAGVPLDTLSKWTETVAMMLSSPLSQETSAALTALGDQLATNQLYEAAHACYLLAPQTSPLGGIGHPSARIVLVGSRNPPSSFKDQDPIIFSEVVEFALSLTPLSKGQETFSGIPHLQAYRLIRAMTLVEIGDIQQAKRYCDAITAAVNRGSPYATPALVEQLKGLSDRISGVTHVDKSFWTGAKLSKPSLDTIGGWLEGRFTKLVTGDADMEQVAEETNKPNVTGFSGPFSHYSTISSTTPSARSSPQPSLVNTNVLPPVRSGSAMANTSPYAYPTIDRASSAADYVRRKPSPTPRIASANASTTSFAAAPSFSQALENQKAHNGYSPSDDLVTPRPSLTSENDEDTVQETSWWGGTGYAEGASTQTPTASTFLHVGENTVPASSSSDGFISLMDNVPYTVGPQTSNSHSAQASRSGQDDVEDLGFGNSKRDKADIGKVDETEVAKPPPSQETKSTTPPQPASGGWLSRWWKKSDTSGPVKANLGESSTFYYDKEQKRWVNKKADTVEVAKPATPPPPPSRAQTASPAMTGPRPSGSDSGPPPNRSASAIDLSTSPPSRTTMRVRSSLVPTPESAPSTPTGSRLAPAGPPPGRPRSQAGKRNIRSRYVDVFQQESST